MWCLSGGVLPSMMWVLFLCVALGVCVLWCVVGWEGVGGWGGGGGGGGGVGDCDVKRGEETLMVC